MFKLNRINRIALVAAITVCSALTALASNRITIGDGTPIAIKPGESKVIAVNLTNDEQIAGLQFDMEFTSSKIQIVEGSLKVNEARVGREEFTTTLYHKTTDGKWRYTILTRPDAINVISGSEGALGYFTIKASDDFKNDDNAKILFSTCSGSTPEAKKAIIDIHESLDVTPLVGSFVLGETAFSIKPGGTHKVDVELNNEIDLYGLQTDITLPKGLHIAKNDKGKFDFTYSDRLPQEFTISSAERDGFVRVVVSCLPVVKITGNSSTVFSFNVEADADFVSDENSKITFSNALASDNVGSLYTLDTANAVATVTSLKPVNEAAYTRLSAEIAELQKLLDDAVAKVAEECKDVADNYTDNVTTIQTLITNLKTDLDNKYASCDLNEESALDAQAVADIKADIEKYISDAQEAQAYFVKKAANEAAYKRLSEELAAVQARFDEVKNIIRTDYATVVSQFSSTELTIQIELKNVANDLKAKYDTIELNENSTLDLQILKDAIEQLLEDAKKAYETTSINGTWMNADGAGYTGIYTINGTKVETIVKGTSYIIRYANGKTMKVVVK